MDKITKIILKGVEDNLITARRRIVFTKTQLKEQEDEERRLEIRKHNLIKYGWQKSSEMQSKSETPPLEEATQNKDFTAQSVSPKVCLHKDKKQIQELAPNYYQCMECYSCFEGKP